MGSRDLITFIRQMESAMGPSRKYWDVAAIPKGIAAMPPIAAILQQYLAMGIAAMLLQHCNCSCIAAVLLQYPVAAILPQWGHCCNTLCTLQQFAMPLGIAYYLKAQGPFAHFATLP